VRGRRAVACAAVVFASLAPTGCGTSGGGTSAGSRTAPPASSAVPVAPTSTPPVTASGACSTAYFPVIAGASWTYRSRVAQTTAEVHQTFAAITDAGFTTVSSSSQGAERDVWTCAPAGLADVRQHSSGAGGSITFGGQTFQTDVQNFHHYRSRGITIPTHLEVGSSWSQVVRSSSRFALAGSSYPETQVVSTVSRVVGRGSVSTPAGTFDALKVLTTATTRKAIPALGQDLTSVTHGTLWVVRDVGIVESTTTNSSGFASTTVLLAYRLPGGG
jgi:hypothetical protein